ncbi:MAG: hypothetical protein R2746_15495 [Acidimicrobiales bacterium]
MSSSDALAPAPPPGRRHPVGSIVAVVVGGLLLLTSIGVLGAGAALTWAHATQRDDDGYFTSDQHHFETLRSAITTEELDLGFDEPRGTDIGDLATIRVRVAGEREQPVFVGIGPSDRVDDYLAGVGRAQIDDISTDPSASPTATRGAARPLSRRATRGSGSPARRAPAPRRSAGPSSRAPGPSW